tara:strand:- start:33981 stop:34814 length:834 start_codon:yes stop_codon:yes gene_type:complete
MRFFKRLLNFYINSSVHVALAVFSLVWITLIEFDIAYDNNILYFVFYASITGYNFVKYFSLAKFHHRRLAIWLKWIQVLSFVCFCLTCYYAFQLHTQTLSWIAAFGLLTFFYAMPFLPKRSSFDTHQNLRSIGGIKVYIIALSWMGVTVFLPLINNTYAMDADVILVASQRFLFVLVLMLPFEIRDLQYDSLKLGTIPQKIGLKKTKLLGVSILVLMLVLEFFKDVTSVRQIVIFLIVLVITFVFLVFSEKHQKHYYSAFWVEGIPILWLVLLLLFI